MKNFVKLKKRNTYQQYLQDELVKYKKYFYALRPLLAARYIEENQGPPPVLFDDLLQMNLPSDLRSGIDELLKKKKITQEKDLNPQIPVIQNFIQNELHRQKLLTDTMKDDRSGDWTSLNQLFIHTII